MVAVLSSIHGANGIIQTTLLCTVIVTASKKCIKIDKMALKMYVIYSLLACGLVYPPFQITMTLPS
jgi:hypothetical protein